MSRNSCEFNERASIVILVLTILLYAVVIGSLISFVWRLPEVSSSQQYDMFRDLLMFFLALLAAIGAGTFYLVKRFVLEAVEDKIKAGEWEVWRACSMLFGLLYFRGLQDRDTERAVEITSAVFHEKPTLEWDTLRDVNMTYVKNNLAYYYADMHEQGQQQDRPRWDLKPDALEWAEQVRSKYREGTPWYDEPEWLETYAFVLARFAETDKDKHNARQIIDGFLQRKIPEALKQGLERSKQYIEGKK